MQRCFICGKTFKSTIKFMITSRFFIEKTNSKASSARTCFWGKR
jgi:hypothetical protein